MKKRITSLHMRPERGNGQITYRGVWRDSNGRIMIHTARNIVAVKAVMASTGWLFWHGANVKTFWYMHPFGFDECKHVASTPGNDRYGFPDFVDKNSFVRQFDLDERNAVQLPAQSNRELPAQLQLNYDNAQVTFSRILFYDGRHNPTYIKERLHEREWTHYVTVEGINYLVGSLTEAYAFQAEYGGIISERLLLSFLPSRGTLR